MDHGILIRSTRTELIAEREQLRREWKLDDKEFAPLERWRDLNLDESLAQDRLDDISFLLGER